MNMSDEQPYQTVAPPVWWVEGIQTVTVTEV